MVRHFMVKIFMLKNLITPLLSIVTLALLLLTNSAAAGTLTASVDRKEMTENDNFRLFLRYDEHIDSQTPDLSPLKNNFNILSLRLNHQERKSRNKNIKPISFSEWIIILSPLTHGKITIPSIYLDGESSQEIELTVKKSLQEKPFFFGIEVDTTPTYVQAQILYTVKVYYTAIHNNPRLNPLDIANARVLQLGNDRQYNRINIDGENIGVYERNYAIFPEESGVLVIPGQIFSATIPSPYNRLRREETVSIVTKPINIDVMPTPPTYPQAPWLPSPQLKISDSWSNTYSEWQVGEPVTRTISINAQGLSGSQLPELSLPEVEGLKYYPDQSEHNDKTDNQGIQGFLQQSLAIVPTQSGRVTIPEMRIPWWNLETNRLEYAILPTQTVTVAAAENLATVGSSQLTNTPSNAYSDAANNAVVINDQNNGYWIAATLFLLVTNLISAFLLWRSRSIPVEKGINHAEPSNKERLKNIKKACQDNNPLLIRQRLKEWSQQEFGISSLDELGQLFNSIALTNSLSELDSVLYQNSDNSAFNGQILWNNLSQAIKKNHSSSKTDQSELSPLYQ